MRSLKEQIDIHAAAKDKKLEVLQLLVKELLEEVKELKDVIYKNIQ